MNKNIDDPFWKEDPTILFNKHRLIEFVPTSDMSTNEKLNALSRFMIYFGILLSLVYKSHNPIFIPLIGITILYLIHEHYPSQIGGVTEHVQPSTKENPFMNVLISDYVDNPQKKPAGDYDLVKDDINKNFAHGLYKDVDDIWDKNNSQRQFYTNPSTTIPNDRDSFMKWCWSTPYTCKDGNLSRCLKYEDTRANGRPV